ncbi:MAG: hypothetical protein ACTSX7_12850 [Alphaproteobacteria bacterium]
MNLVPGARSARLRRREAYAGLVLGLVGASLILGFFYNRFWWPADEGVFAHVAARVLAGEVLHRDVVDIHPGYVTLVNALVFHLFGLELVSLRYPLVAVGLVQAGIMALLFSGRGAALAALVAVSFTALSFVQFLNPTAHWYALGLMVTIIGVLAWAPVGARGRLEAIGLLLAMVFLFRQLTGVLVGVGVLTWLLCEVRAGTGRVRLVRGLLGLMAVGLLAYLATKAHSITLILFAPWPLAILAWAGWVVRVGDRQVLVLVGRLAAGAVFAVAPLVAYHLSNGSVGDWLGDVFVTALALTELDFFAQASYGDYLILGLINILRFDNLAAVLNGMFWVSAVLLSGVTGWLVLRSLLRDGRRGRGFHPLPFLAVFYALVSVHFQNPPYLFASLPLTLAALLWLTADTVEWRSWAPIGLAGLLTVVGLVFQAGQPLTRGIIGIVEGQRVAGVMSTGPRWAGLRIDGGSNRDYTRTVALIRRESALDEAIFVLPMNPELYFLADRRNPFDFFSTALSVRDDARLAEVLGQIAQAPPRLVLFRADDKYNTNASRVIMDQVRRQYVALGIVSGFEVYRYEDKSRRAP